MLKVINKLKNKKINNKWIKKWNKINKIELERVEDEDGEYY